jgi:hypothetical protein
MRRVSTRRGGGRHPNGCNENSRHNMNDSINKVIEQLTGKPCWRKQVGRNRSLSLGFGGMVHRKSQQGDRLYGEWEVGTYYGAWRVFQGGRVLCGSQDPVDSVDDLNAILNRIEFGGFAYLRQFTNLDVRIEFDNALSVDFLATISGDDECFHIFCPESLYVEFSVVSGWRLGKSNNAWEGRSS